MVFPKRSIKTIQNEPESTWQLRKHANILIHIFPNTTMLIQPDHAMVLSVFPIDEKTTSIAAFMLIPEPAISQKAIDYWDLNAKIFWDAIEEDNDMAVLQQKSFNGYPNAFITVGSYESLVLQFENLVDDAIDKKLVLTDFQ